MGEFLNLSSTQLVLSQHQDKKWVDRVLDGLVKLMDICSNVMDLMSQMKEQLGDIRSCLRKRKGDSSIENNIAKFTSFRAKMKKEVKRMVSILKPMENGIQNFPILDLDHHLQVVISVIREVSYMTISKFQTLLTFLCGPISKPNSTKWSLVSKITRKSRVACEAQVENMNEFIRFDATLSSIRKCGSSEMEGVQLAQNRVEALEFHVEEIKSGLNCIFRQLIRTRASLLNVFSY